MSSLSMNLHHVKQIVQSDIHEETRSDKSNYYITKLKFIFDELGTCRESRSSKTMFGMNEVPLELTLFAETREALELKVKALT